MSQELLGPRTTTPRQSWRQKFACAMRGTKCGIRGESSFFVHFFMAAAVVAAAWVLGVNLLQWCLLILCIAGVLAAEMFNCALERMAKAITRQHDPHLGDALDIGSAAVLVACVGAVFVGAVIFLHRLGVLLSWWAE